MLNNGEFVYTPYWVMVIVCIMLDSGDCMMMIVLSVSGVGDSVSYVV